MNNEAFTIRSFCQAYGVGRSFTYSEMAAGKLSYRKAGKKTLIMRADAQRWADNLPKGGPHAETA